MYYLFDFFQGHNKKKDDENEDKHHANKKGFIFIFVKYG